MADVTPLCEPDIADLEDGLLRILARAAEQAAAVRDVQREMGNPAIGESMLAEYLRQGLAWAEEYAAWLDAEISQPPSMELIRHWRGTAAYAEEWAAFYARQGAEPETVLQDYLQGGVADAGTAGASSVQPITQMGDGAEMGRGPELEAVLRGYLQGA